MANTTENLIWFTGKKRLGVRCTFLGDTAETDVVKIDKSALTGLDGTEPSKIIIEEAVGHVKNMDYVLLEFDGTTDTKAILFPEGTSYHDFTMGGGLDNPASGATGDLVATCPTPGGTGAYQIDLIVRLMD